MFLSDDELFHLPGSRQKRKQLARLKQMGIPCWINAAGQPVVARAVIEGRKPQARQSQEWTPAWAEGRL
jgi:putative SOS response-associated peptidase YedK